MDINEIELRRLDLTVLLVFVNLMRLRKASESDLAEVPGISNKLAGEIVEFLNTHRT